MLNKVWMVFLGGGLGAICRYGIAVLMNSKMDATFPWNTLLVNLLGCFLIGTLWAWNKHGEQPLLSLFLMTGFLGGFTTFSSFGLESMFLLKEGKIASLIVYVMASNLLGLFLVISGNKLFEVINR